MSLGSATRPAGDVKRDRRRVALVAAGIATGTLAMRLPSLTEPAWYYDDGVFTTVAWAMSKGVRLYTGVFDLQPPGIYWLYRLLIGMGAREHHWVTQITAAIVVVASALLVWELARRWMPLRCAALAGGLTGFALSLPPLDGDFLNVEVAALPFFLAALLVAYGPRLPAMFLAGALLGVALAFRPSFAVSGLALAVPLLSTGGRIPRLLVAGLGLAAVIGTVVAALWLEGSLDAYLSIVAPSDRTYFLLANGGTYVPLFVRLVLFGAIAALGLARARSAPGRLVAAWLPASLAGATLTPVEFTHFAHEAIPALAFAIALRASRIRWRWSVPPVAAFALVVCAELVLILPAQQTALMESRTPPRPFLHEIGYQNLPSYYANWFSYVSGSESGNQYAGYFGEQDRQDAEVALLQGLAPSSDARLMVLGSRSWIYAESGLLPATPYVSSCASLCIVPSEPADIRRSLDGGCADVVVAVGLLEDWRGDLVAGGYVEVPGAPWPTFRRGEPRPPCA